MKMKQNQIFFHGTYTNFTSYSFKSKNIKPFQRLSKSNFLSFMAEINPNNGNKTSSDIFRWDIIRSDVIYFFYEKTLKHFNEFQNKTFSILWLT